MRAVREFPSRELQWVQPERLNRHFELRHGDDLLGTLRWEKACGSLATGVVAESQWTFKRGGFLRPHVTVREAGSPDTIAVFEASWGAGTLECPGSRRFRWAPSDFWRSRWTWGCAGCPEIAAFSSDPKFMKKEGRLEVSTQGAELPELPLLALLGWYLLILAADDAAVVAVIVSS